jgi:putative alpha-1,2-mannosidase
MPFRAPPTSTQPRLFSGAAYDAVDPFIGTQGGGHTFPGAVVPFGMVQLSPDTQTRYFKESYPWAAGYQYGDPTILGFSHIHFSGAGHSDLGDVLVTPIAGDVRLEPGNAQQPLSGYRSRFSHDSERAEPARRLPTRSSTASPSLNTIRSLHRGTGGTTFRSTFSLWDTYRALHPLLTLLRPQSDNADFVRSLLASWRERPDGVLPVWQFHGQETWTMIGYHAVPVIADAYLKRTRRG